MEDGLPERDVQYQRYGGWSSGEGCTIPKVSKKGNDFLSPNLHALVSVSKLISLSHVLCLRQSLLHLHVLR